VDERGLASVRVALEDFAGEVFSGFARSDQRATGVRYLRGLMLDGRRKSMQPMAERLGVDHQQLQQFLTSSTWDYAAVRRRLAAKAIDVVDPVAWVIDDTGFAKDGNASPGVARQYSGTLGKVGNCQVAVSVHAATDAASAVLDWRLFLPESWDPERVPAADGGPDGPVGQAIRARRDRSRIPADQHHQAKWELALGMLDELAGWGHVPPVVVADAGYGDTTAFRTALTARGIPYVVAVRATTSAHPGDAVPVTPPRIGSRGPAPRPAYPDPASSLAELALAAGRSSLRTVTWRTGTKTSKTNPDAAMTSRFAALRVRPANRDNHRNDDGSLPDCWLIIEWPTGAPAPTDYWLSTLPPHTPLKTLVRLAKIRWRIEHDYRELKQGLGLDHFEGRSWTGWHRHVTLASAAQLFLTTLRTNPKHPGQT
jgi:SRSO17 transposase